MTHSSGSNEQPAYGHERIMLIPTRSKKGAHRLERQVFAEKGFTQFWVDSEKDWVSWRGEYVPIEVLGHFDSWDSARQFMIERSEAGNERATATTSVLRLDPIPNQRGGPQWPTPNT